MTTTTYTTADQAWRAYQDAKGGRHLHELGASELERALAIHAEFLRLDRLVRVRRVRVATIQVALDWCSDEYVTDGGHLVRFGATYVEGAPEGLLELADAVAEGAEVNAELRESDAADALAELRVRRTVEAAGRIVRRIREGVRP